ncbi:MAG: 50S ribosomal protein L10, partial [Caedimonadaceae bacterium]
MDKQEKHSFVASLRSDLSDAGIVVITRQTGLTVGESTKLRIDMRKVGGRFKVAKNTLIRRAVADSAYDALKDELKGPVALAFSNDPIAAAKVAVDFAKANDKLEVICGMMGEKFLNKNDVVALAKLPSLDELRGKIIGVLQAPASKIVGVLQAPGAQVARVISAYSNK